MNRVKRIARKRYYLQRGLSPEMAEEFSDNRAFRGSFHPGKDAEMKPKVALEVRAQRVKAFINRLLGKIPRTQAPRRTV